MSLQEILSQHSRDISARIQHQNDQDQEVLDRKANTLQEKAQHIRDAITNAGVELGGAGAAVHLGTKVYRQYKERAFRRAQQMRSRDNATETGAEPATEAPRVEAPVEAPPPSTELGARADDIQARFHALRQRVQGAEESRAPSSAVEPAEQEHGGADAPATETSNPATLEGQQDRATAVSERQAGEPMGDSTANPVSEAAGRAEPTEMDFMRTKSATPRAGEPVGQPVHNQANVETPAEARGDADDIEEGARAFMNPTTGEARAASNIASRSADNSSVIDNGINGAKKVVGNLTKTGGEVATDATEGILPEVAEGLSFLGPIGEILGVLTGIGGMLASSGEDAAKKVQTAGLKAGDVASSVAGVGLDTSALQTQAKTGGAITTAY